MRMCCVTLIKTKNFGGMVKDLLSPMVEDMSKE
jgi:hypothetical protein